MPPPKGNWLRSSWTDVSIVWSNSNRSLRACLASISSPLCSYSCSWQLANRAACVEGNRSSQSSAGMTSRQASSLEQEPRLIRSGFRSKLNRSKIWFDERFLGQFSSWSFNWSDRLCVYWKGKTVCLLWFGWIDSIKVREKWSFIIIYLCFDRTHQSIRFFLFL